MAGALFWWPPHGCGVPTNHESTTSRSTRSKVHPRGDEPESAALVSQAFFLDTNVFVYSFDHSQPRKQKRAESLIVEAIESEQCAISTQVIQEFLNVALGKFAAVCPLVKPPGSSTGSCGRSARSTLPPVSISGAVSIMEETGWAFYDSLIVSAAAAARCPVLFTEDLQTGRVVRGVEIRNPFV